MFRDVGQHASPICAPHLARRSTALAFDSQNDLRWLSRANFDWAREGVFRHSIFRQTGPRGTVTLCRTVPRARSLIILLSHILSRVKYALCTLPVALFGALSI